jgi:hypothetical protein
MAAEKFYFGKFDFHISAVDNLDLPPYKGSTFRGTLGHALQKLSCHCEDSDDLTKHNCAYGYLMGISALHTSKTSSQSPPHPLILEPPDNGKCLYNSGEKLWFRTVLIGNSMNYLTYMILAVQRMGQMGIGRGRGEFMLESVDALSVDSKENIYSEAESLLSVSLPQITWQDILNITSPVGDVDNVTLRFETPVRFKNEGRLTGDKGISFSLIMRNLLERASRLERYYCGAEERWDFSQLLDIAESVEIVESDLHWRDWERYSSRQQTKMMLGGLMGDIKFKGDLTQFLPYLVLGSHIHVGKNTVFGLGKYELRFERGSQL